MGRQGFPRPGLGEQFGIYPSKFNYFDLFFFLTALLSPSLELGTLWCPAPGLIASFSSRRALGRAPAAPGAAATELRIPPGSSVCPPGRQLRVVPPNFGVVWGKNPHLQSFNPVLFCHLQPLLARTRN